MATVEILIEGYARAEGDTIVATCTTTIIREGGKLIIVDPGIHRQLLLQKLEDAKLQLSDIDIVFMTHYHPDHVFNAALFEHAQIIDGDTVYKDDLETFYEGTIPGTSIAVIPTPGHAHEHATPLVETEDGVVAVAQDVFWWMDGEQDTSSREALLSLKDPFAKDMAELRKSREKVLAVADQIIPGHGKMFENKFKTAK